MSPIDTTIRPLAANHVLIDTDLTPDETRQVLELGLAVKRSPKDFGATLRGRYAAMLFEKPSLRTRVTFELGMKQLGGDAVFQDHKGDRIGEREPARDMARNLDRWFDVIIARTYSQDTLEDLAEWSSVPVVNALSGMNHPCQALADYLTLRERHEDLAGLTVAYVGDGNNVAHSLLLTGAALGVNVNFAGPEGYEAEAEVIAKAQALGAATGAKIQMMHDPRAAVEGAVGVYTDVWTSMGWERETQERRIAFAQYQVNAALMALAAPEAIFMHCLPALRGEEVTDQVMESAQSAVFDQAENRLHAQKALLMMLLAG
jgi:ornithine carbamoyltransferase